jgi:hypothetical protein
MQYCSPLGEDNFKEKHTCFSLKALQDIANAWNKENPHNRIKNIKKLSINDLWNQINIKMSDRCGKGKEFCWVKNIKTENKTKDVRDAIRPEKPSEWYKDKNSWLSNYDIQNVMRQYQDKKDLKYRFLGVFAIDFETATEFGKCLYKEICSLNILQLYKQGYKYIGMITNLDKHDEPGSHWTSLFICIDPTKPSFGAHYYDSTATEPPIEITNFYNTLNLQANDIINLAIKKTKNKIFKFEFNYNTIQHQYGNNECGMFSMVYQINWLKFLKKNKNTTLQDVISNKVTDKQMNQYFRNILFAPNTRIEIDKKKK